MPTLNWTGKDAVVTPHKVVPYSLLEPVPKQRDFGAIVAELAK